MTMERAKVLAHSMEQLRSVRDDIKDQFDAEMKERDAIPLEMIGTESYSSITRNVHRLVDALEFIDAAIQMINRVV